VRSPRAIAYEWGSTASERALDFPCDALLPDAELEMYRAVDVAAPPSVAFRWLCQLRAAPYSYDWIDNLGRRSPRELTPGLEQLEVGQRFITIFRVTGFERDRQITALCSGNRLFGDVAGTYMVVPADGGDCRIVVKLLAVGPRRLGFAYRGLLPYGDLVMMRKQLLTLKRLAEESAARSG
jgi:hypothetical protein